MIDLKRNINRIYHIGEFGKEIRHYENGEVSYPRLTKGERIEWKAKLHFDKQIERAAKIDPKLEILPHWDLDIDMLKIKLDIYQKKLKGVDVIHEVNEWIRTIRLVFQG